MSLCFPDQIELRDAGLVNGSRVFELLKPFRYIGSRGTITVPAHTRSDGASVPRPFWSILDPFGPHFAAAIIHDFLYSKQSTELYCFDRKESDEIFLEAMGRSGIGFAARQVIYGSVRLFGWRSYKRK